VLTFYRSLSQRLEARNLRVIALSLSVRQEWSAELDDGMLLMLGRDDGELWARLDRYLRTQQQTRTRLGQMSTALGQAWVRVDLRHNLGYAVAIGREGRDARSNTESADDADTAETASEPPKAARTPTLKSAINNSVKNEPSRSQGR
jgi:cell division septal protein FtsQ